MAPWIHDVAETPESEIDTNRPRRAVTHRRRLMTTIRVIRGRSPDTAGAIEKQSRNATRG